MHGSSEVKMIATGHDELFSGTTRCAHELRTPGGEVGPPSHAAPQAPRPEPPTGMSCFGRGDWKNLGFCRVMCPLVGRPVTENDPGFLVCPEPRISQQGSAVAAGAGVVLGGHCRL